MLISEEADPPNKELSRTERRETGERRKNRSAKDFVMVFLVAYRIVYTFDVAFLWPKAQMKAPMYLGSFGCHLRYHVSYLTVRPTHVRVRDSPTST